MGVGARVAVAVGATTTGLCMTTNVRSDGATDAADTDDATAAVAVTAATATTRERQAAMVTGRCDEVATEMAERVWVVGMGAHKGACDGKWGGCAW